MTTFTARYSTKVRRIGSGIRSAKRAAFTIPEVVMTLTLSGLILGSMISTFITFAIGAYSIGAYSEMSQDSRIVLEQFARDMRAAEDVTVAEADKITVVFPDASIHDGSSVTYEFDKDLKLFFRIENDKSGKEVANKSYLEGLEFFSFSYFDPLGNPLSLNTQSILLSVKSVQIDAEMLRDISRAEATDYIISARFMMRNRPVTD